MKRPSKEMIPALLLAAGMLLGQNKIPEQLARKYSPTQLHDMMLLDTGFAYGFFTAASTFDNSDAVSRHSCQKLREADALVAREFERGRIDNEVRKYIDEDIR